MGFKEHRVARDKKQAILNALTAMPMWYRTGRRLGETRLGALKTAIRFTWIAIR